jgi:hypothetical protein
MGERRERRGRQETELGGGEREAKQGMILTTAKNQQKHSDELFVRNSCIWALQICILASRTIGKHWIKLVVLQQWLLYVCSPHRSRPKLLLASSFLFTTISY